MTIENENEVEELKAATDYIAASNDRTNAYKVYCDALDASIGDDASREKTDAACAAYNVATVIACTAWGDYISEQEKEINKMNIENEVEKLKSISDAADNARDIAYKALNNARNARIGFPVEGDNSVTSRIQEHYNTTHKAAVAAWDAYISTEQRITIEKNKMNELKSTAIATRDARAVAFTNYSAVCIATDDAWDAYLSACKIARNAADASNVYEARTYGCYADEER